jgi:hypothetical protein
MELQKLINLGIYPQGSLNPIFIFCVMTSRTEKYDYIMSRTNLDLGESQKKLVCVDSFKAAYLIVQRGGDVQEEQRLPIYTGSTLFGSANQAVGLLIRGLGVSSIHGLFGIFGLMTKYHQTERNTLLKILIRQTEPL